MSELKYYFTLVADIRWQRWDWRRKVRVSSLISPLTTETFRSGGLHLIHEAVIAVDTGGTFTDLVIIDASGSIRVLKLSSTPEEPSLGVITGIRESRTAGYIHDRFMLVHGTTVATNSLLERKGARCAVITTEGFRDVLEIGRQTRTDLYSLTPSRPAPLLSTHDRYEVRERLSWRGEILCPLDVTCAESLIERLSAEGYESIAICFLFSYLNSEHEVAVGELVRQTGMAVSISCEIAPEPREYERTATTVANAFVSPKVSGYLSRLEKEATSLGAVRVRIMQSNGGALSAAEAAKQPIKTALSGPAGGVSASVALCRSLNQQNALTIDMGGTSTDVALIHNGQCAVVTEGAIADIPLRTPLYDIHTVGAGGGSIVRLDAAGALRVGPQSAGANPGPVAYGVGVDLTVTDANVALGRLPADLLLGDRLPLDRERTLHYFAILANRMGCGIDRAAAGVLEVANHTMVRALRHISTERGKDPADYTLISFGGAGGLHACALADALSISTIVVPRYPGAFSALGLAMAPVSREFAQAFPSGVLLSESENSLHASFKKLVSLATEKMEREGLKPGEWSDQLVLDLRYTGQAFALRVAASSNPRGGVDLKATASAFHIHHKERYGHADPSNPIEVVTARLISTETAGRLPLHVDMPTAHGRPYDRRQVYTGQGWQEVKIYSRQEIAVDQKIAGPALVCQSDATLFIDCEWKSVTDVSGDLLLRNTNVS